MRAGPGDGPALLQTEKVGMVGDGGDVSRFAIP